MTSLPFRPRSSEDWQPYRPIILNLYINDQLKLKDVKEIMERDYNFVASEKQYKDRLAAWKARKNIKTSEARIMLRKQQERSAQGKRSAFRVGGMEVGMHKILRAARRSRNTATSGSSPEPETPSDISCYTPVDRPSTPETQAFDESFSQSSSYSQPPTFPQHADFSQPPPVPYYDNILCGTTEHPDVSGFGLQPPYGGSWESSLLVFQDKLHGLHDKLTQDIQNGRNQEMQVLMNPDMQQNASHGSQVGNGYHWHQAP
ncbi:hypothetical protein DTO271G3_477 [Paecilomyces variotii]|nr:hypothetical protein DTO271G3_477 [Paecilomyces variotii]